MFSKQVLLRALVVLGLACCSAYAATLSGTVKDPSGSVLANADIEIAAAGSQKVLHTGSDAGGRFRIELPPGQYIVGLSVEKFRPFSKEITVPESGLDSLDLKLSMAEVQQEVSVTGTTSSMANSDPAYRQLRDVQPQ